MALKKTFSVLMSAALTLAMLAGCGGKTEENPGADTAQTSGQSASSPAAAAEEDDSLWKYGQVAFGGGGFVTGVFPTCEKGIYYARTDVGGAYRWSDEEKAWTSLNYWVTPDDVGYLGIDGLASDPGDASKLYLLAGTEYFSDGSTVLLKSTDYGAHFDIIDLTDKIRVHGNGMGRGNGERIAVDPENTDTIFAGGRTGGMIKSTDGGNTWASVESFPVKDTNNRNGINGILFDGKGKIYASVSRKNDDNIYVSQDGGASWKPLENACREFMPQRMKLDSSGTLYVTYGSEEGPWNQQNGAVYRYKDGSAENIAPSDRPFGDILIDPDDSNKMVLVTTQTWMPQPNGAFGDAFYTTTDGGKNWDSVLSKAKMSTNGMEWIHDCAIHWCSCLSMDPFDSSRIMVTSGNGIFACDDIWAERPEFYFNSRGIEETVPLDILSLEGMPLAVAAGDYDGFMSSDIAVSGERFGDGIGTTVSITIAPQNTSYWAKLGSSNNSFVITYTTDNGATWHKITNNPEPGKKPLEGRIAFTADGSRLLWSPGNSVKVYYTDDFGKNWNECSGIIGKGVYMISDPQNSDYVYALGGSAYRSSDGGKTFEKINQIMSPAGKMICVDPHNEGTFYIPDMTGLYRFTSHGDSFEIISAVKGCEVISLGKAKTDGAPLTMYVYGSVDGGNGRGVYMSDDNGATWSPVTDEKHQFGGLGNGGFICGDMNVYGRCYMSTVGLGLVYCDLKDKN